MDEGITTLTGAGGTLGSVSSTNGRYFYAPTELKGTVDEYEDVTFDEINNIESSKNPYVGVLKYNLTVTAAKGEAGKKLKITVAATPTGDVITDAYRVAVYMTGAAYTTAATVPEDDNLAVGAFSAVYGKTAGTNQAYATATEPGNQVVKAIGNSDTIPASTYQTAVDKDVSANFVVAVWMEGNVAESQNAAGGQKVSVAVDFELVA